VTLDRFDYSALLRPGLPPAAAKWAGFPKYNFVGGHNDPDALPIVDLIAAAERVLSRDGKYLATYGLQSGPQGHGPLRDFIVGKLAKDAGILCTADDVLITSGSLQGLDLVNQVLLSPGDTVIVEEMTYGGAITRLQRLGARIIGVPVDKEGMSTAALSETLQDLERKGIRPKYIYTIPTVQNPTATIMSEARRFGLLDLAHRYRVPIFEDECYADLVWDGTRPPALFAMARNDGVIHIGSFSKSIAPALRIGYLVAKWPLLSRILAIKNDGGSGALEQLVLAEFCPEHFETHVLALRKALRRKAEALMQALRAQFGTEVEFDDPSGGIFLWVTLPDPVDTTRLTQLGLKAGVAVNPGAEWMTEATGGKARIRICFAHPSEQIIREGISTLADVCQREFGIPQRRDRGVHR
jgi:2-aminoadipate transaminase